MKVSQNIENEKTNGLNSLTWRRPYADKPINFEKINNSIRINKLKLNQIKDNSIKDFIYSNRQVPLIWKSKSGYNDQVIKLLADDEIFLSYMGNICKNGAKKLGDIKILSYKSKAKKANEIKKIKKIQLFRNKTMDERDVDNYLKKLDKLYPIKGKLNDLFDKKILLSLNKNNNININQNIKPKLRLSCVTANKIKSDINGNIYTKLVSKKSRNSEDKKFHRSQSAINSNYKKDKKKENVSKRSFIFKNSNLMKQLESINYFGPYFSYCSECAIKNINFYKNIESDVLFDIIKQIKNIKDKQLLERINSKKKAKK
jgi:hypothetical protein